MTTGLQGLLLASDPVIPNSADVGVFSVANCILLDFWWKSAGIILVLFWKIKACKWPWKDEHKPHKRRFAVKICSLTLILLRSSNFSSSLLKVGWLKNPIRAVWSKTHPNFEMFQTCFSTMPLSRCLYSMLFINILILPSYRSLINRHPSDMHSLYPNGLLNSQWWHRSQKG